MPWLRYRRRKPAYSFVSLVCDEAALDSECSTYPVTCKIRW